ncbi:hypothetical protein DAEQUDRAFT_181986 [Daedalea quercina L-15889]|uniref:F-box domain-containing protein n=1 Tax=Daedalea quercina L-15889 TaxID=1314783 RepID=A0A165RF02_9APHY|nr:hypothetical protein DAEQUDRAFT_181986 [Daedalea quercina L-15889]
MYSVFGSTTACTYHSSFVESMGRFTKLVHLTLIAFEFRSFVDLRRFICSLPKLCELELSGGRLSSASAASVNAEITPEHDYWPRLRSLTLEDLDPNLWTPLASWVASTNVCKSLTALHFDTMNNEATRLCLERTLEACGPSLIELWYNVNEVFGAEFTNLLAYCTNISNVALSTTINPAASSWRAVVAELSNLPGIPAPG